MGGGLLCQLEPPECPFEELFGKRHVLRNVGLKVAGTGLPVVGRVSDAARQEDELVGLDRRKDAVFGVTTDHAKAVDEHPDEEIGLTQRLAILSGHDATIHKCR